MLQLKIRITTRTQDIDCKKLTKDKRGDTDKCCVPHLSLAHFFALCNSLCIIVPTSLNLHANITKSNSTATLSQEQCDYSFQ